MSAAEAIHNQGISAPSASTEKNQVPLYSVYGNQVDGKEKWFVSVEPLSRRCEERGWIIEPHIHPNFAQLVIISQGSGTCGFGDNKMGFSGATAITVPVQSVHSFHYQKETHGWVITLEQSYLNQINRHLGELGSLWDNGQVICLPKDDKLLPEIYSSIKKIDLELAHKEIGHFIAVEAELTSIMLHLLRHMTPGKIAEAESTSFQPRLVREFKKLLAKNFDSGWKLDHYAEMLRTSAAQLRTACEEVCGQPPMKMVYERRLTEAKRSLIFDEKSITQIAYSLGFSSPAYFARFFKNETGISASDFRKNGRGKDS